MQLQNIKKPQLFTEVLIWNSEYLTYIYTTTLKIAKNVTSIIHNNTILIQKQIREDYENLSKLSKKLFKTLPKSRKEFDVVQNKLSKLLKSI